MPAVLAVLGPFLLALAVAAGAGLRAVHEIAWPDEIIYLVGARNVLELLGRIGVNPECLGLTASGHPRHPLYIAGSVKPVSYFDFHTRSQNVSSSNNVSGTPNHRPH